MHPSTTRPPDLQRASRPPNANNEPRIASHLSAVVHKGAPAVEIVSNYAKGHWYTSAASRTWYGSGPPVQMVRPAHKFLFFTWLESALTVFARRDPLAHGRCCVHEMGERLPLLHRRSLECGVEDLDQPPAAHSAPPSLEMPVIGASAALKGSGCAAPTLLPSPSSAPAIHTTALADHAARFDTYAASLARVLAALLHGRTGDSPP
ncbi:hypothetical protein MSAN_01920700 [Mycena sanguinolenta]|uniref:Uncharacterized protein n=1 Tax=Mycena sanguinolenta TaxID=230812 RepID=A0A8H7CNL0_9AGAR|nr:hypothetical protein MSAN_01920700 [Mycena sanguinolenta]